MGQAAGIFCGKSEIKLADDGGSVMIFENQTFDQESTLINCKNLQLQMRLKNGD